MIKPKLKYFLVVLFSIYSLNSYSQIEFLRSFRILENMLNGTDFFDLSKAVFAVENAYYDDNLQQSAFDNRINYYAEICHSLAKAGNIRYTGPDFSSVNTQAAVFTFMTDSIPMQIGDSIFYHPPFQYNYEDFAGRKDWSNMFVTTLMATGKGNCHSMPLLYKLIMNKLGEKCWLTLAPNHMYVKAYTLQSGLYNIELTTGYHPTDAWIMASGFIHIDAIRNSLYMDTLTVKEEIALCLFDLAQGYDRKYPGNNGIFVSECCQTVLKYYPDCINARLMQAEMMTRRYLKMDDKESFSAQKLKEEMEHAYTEIHWLGYRKMPEKMYREWLRNSSSYNEKAPNHKINGY
ncbi:hypothetical protein [Coprobacter sp.]